jgi:hypothetical protein
MCMMKGMKRCKNDLNSIKIDFILTESIYLWIVGKNARQSRREIRHLLLLLLLLTYRPLACFRLQENVSSQLAMGVRYFSVLWVYNSVISLGVYQLSFLKFVRTSFAVAYLVEALCYKLEGRRFKSRIMWIFSILPAALWPWDRLSL